MPSHATRIHPLPPDPARPSAAPSRWRAWVHASRPPTLPAAVVPVVVGSASAAAADGFRFGVFLAALVSALFIQIGTNLANDLFDFRKGADTEERTGPLRVTQAGWLTPEQVARGTAIAYAVAVAAGAYLIRAGGWPILWIGVTGILSGILYTGGPWPLGYHGLGDLFAFLYFGVVAVGGTHYAHTGRFDLSLLWIGLPVAFLVTAILVVNNLRDLDTDRKAGKRTLAVRLGRRGTRIEYLLLVLGAYTVPALLFAGGRLSAALFLVYLTVPLAVRMLRIVFTAAGRELNAALGGTGRLHLFYGLLYAAALVLGAR